MADEGRESISDRSILLGVCWSFGETEDECLDAERLMIWETKAGVYVLVGLVGGEEDLGEGLGLGLGEVRLEVEGRREGSDDDQDLSLDTDEASFQLTSSSVFLKSCKSFSAPLISISRYRKGPASWRNEQSTRTREERVEASGTKKMMWRRISLGEKTLSDNSLSIRLSREREGTWRDEQKEGKGSTRTRVEKISRLRNIWEDGCFDRDEDSRVFEQEGGFSVSQKATFTRRRFGRRKGDASRNDQTRRLVLFSSPRRLSDSFRYMQPSC